MTSSNENRIELGRDYYTVPVKVILPEHWLDSVEYKVTEDIVVGDYRVPRGFRSDGASVPRIFWSMFPPVGRYLAAALVHDHALASGRGWSHSNDLFNDVLKSLDVAGWRRALLVGAVRANGMWQKFKSSIGLKGRYVR